MGFDLMARKLQVLMVGCGNIAGKLDEGRELGELPYTHAGAYLRDGKFYISACVEPDDLRREEFMAAWGVATGFRSIDEAFESGRHFDVISICSPTKNHARDLEMALSFNPKLIFCEKPIAASLQDAERIVAQCHKANVQLAVNYTRRWDPDILKLKKSIEEGIWGELRSVVGIYNKGVLNNGSHMFDLLHFLLGKIQIVKTGKPIYDFFEDDPTIPLWLEGEDSLPIHIHCGHAKDFAIFELQFLFSRGMLVMENGGMSWCERHVVDSDQFKGYRMLDAGVRRYGGYARAMLDAVGNIYRAIEEGDALSSTGESALLTQRTSERVRQIALKQNLST